MSQMKQHGKKWVHLRNKYLNFDCNSDTKIWMADIQGGDLSARKRMIQIVNFG